MARFEDAVIKSMSRLAQIYEGIGRLTTWERCATDGRWVQSFRFSG